MFPLGSQNAAFEAVDVEDWSGGGGVCLCLWLSGWAGREDAVPEEGTEPRFEVGEVGGRKGGDGDGEG